MRRVLASFVLFAGAVAHAESLEVRIPFDFVAAGRTLPAGAYTMSVDSGVALIQGTAPGAAAAVLVTRESDRALKPAATFDRGSESSALVKIAFSSGAAYTMISPKHPATAGVIKAPGEVLLSKH